MNFNSFGQNLLWYTIAMWYNWVIGNNGSRNKELGTCSWNIRKVKLEWFGNRIQERSEETPGWISNGCITIDQEMKYRKWRKSKKPKMMSSVMKMLRMKYQLLVHTSTSEIFVEWLTN